MKLLGQYVWDGVLARPGWALLTDSQDRQATLDHIGRGDETADWGCLFVAQADGEIERVLALEGSVPVLDRLCACLYPPHLADA